MLESTATGATDSPAPRAQSAPAKTDHSAANHEQHDAEADQRQLIRSQAPPVDRGR